MQLKWVFLFLLVFPVTVFGEKTVKQSDGAGTRVYNSLDSWHCSPEQISKVDYCHRKSLAQLVAVRDWLRMPSTKQRISLDEPSPFLDYFGSYRENPIKYDYVLKSIDGMVEGITNSTQDKKTQNYNCYNEGASRDAPKTRCSSRHLGVRVVNAYTERHDSKYLGPRNVYFCDGWLDKGWSTGFGFRPLCVILLHELFHAWAAATDHYYFFHKRAKKGTDCVKFRIDRCWGVNNADSLALFVRDVFKIELKLKYHVDPSTEASVEGVQDSAVLSEFAGRLSQEEWKAKMVEFLEKVASGSGLSSVQARMLLEADLEHPGQRRFERFIFGGTSDQHTDFWMKLLKQYHGVVP